MGSYISIVNKADGCAFPITGIIDVQEFVDCVESCIGDSKADKVDGKTIAEIV
jgi:hypothetical protein